MQNLRVRTVGGTGLALSFGKLPGSLCSKYMLVDGEKVAFGSYRYVAAQILEPSWSWSCWDAPPEQVFTVLLGVQAGVLRDTKLRPPSLFRSAGLKISVLLQLHLEFHSDGPEHRHRHVGTDGGLL